MTTDTSAGGLRIQERDVALLRGLFESRVMALAHVALGYFGGRPEAAKKRVQKLKAARLVRERPRMPYEPSVLVLTKAGFRFLGRHGHIADYPRIGEKAFEARADVSLLTIRHELEVASAKVAMMAAAARAPGLSLAEFSTWPRLFEFDVLDPTGSGGYGGRPVRVKPDGFVRVREADAEGVAEHCFFLEVDRSTESLEVLARRAACYVAYYRSGGFAERMGGGRADYQGYPFRALFVFKTAARRNTAMARMAAGASPVRTQAWGTTQAEFAERPLGAIWVRPADAAGAAGAAPRKLSLLE
jgi:hypothetical protein